MSITAVLSDKGQLYITLRDKGFRLTPQRERIIELFYDLPAGEHLGAEELYNQLRQEGMDVSLATSYRTLKLLASLGVLREVAFGDDYKQYELIRDEDAPHHHLVCSTCGATEEFDSEAVQLECDAIARRLGFTLTHTELKLLAKCLPNYPACPLRQADTLG